MKDYAHGLQLNKLSAKGLYESYYFRGSDTEQKANFWIKHNLLQFAGSREIIVELWFIFCHPDFKKAVNVSHKIVLTWDEYTSSPLFKSGNLQNFAYGDNKFAKVSPERLTGKLSDNDNNVEWDLEYTRSGQILHLLQPDLLYSIIFPKKKVVTADTKITYNGTITVNGKAYAITHWQGLNGHNWGKEHAYKYAYSSCNLFNETDDAYFDGYSAKIKVAGLTSPFLSGCTFSHKGKTYNFLPIKRAMSHDVEVFEKFRWHCRFENKDYYLDAKVFEPDTSESALDQYWPKLEYHHPSRKTSTITSSKLASLELKLCDKKTNEVITTLTSEKVEFETLC